LVPAGQLLGGRTAAWEIPPRTQRLRRAVLTQAVRFLLDFLFFIRCLLVETVQFGSGRAAARGTHGGGFCGSSWVGIGVDTFAGAQRLRYTGGSGGTASACARQLPMVRSQFRSYSSDNNPPVAATPSSPSPAAAFADHCGKIYQRKMENRQGNIKGFNRGPWTTRDPNCVEDATRHARCCPGSTNSQ
jgi:hypothetical protein